MIVARGRQPWVKSSDIWFKPRQRRHDMPPLGGYILMACVVPRADALSYWYSAPDGAENHRPLYLTHVNLSQARFPVPPQAAEEMKECASQQQIHSVMSKRRFQMLQFRVVEKGDYQQARSYKDQS